MAVLTLYENTRTTWKDLEVLENLKAVVPLCFLMNLTALLKNVATRLVVVVKISKHNC